MKKIKKILSIALAILISTTPITYAQTFDFGLPEGIIMIEDGQDKIYISDGNVKNIDTLSQQMDSYMENLIRKEELKNTSGIITPQIVSTWYIDDSNTEIINHETATGTSKFDSTITNDNNKVTVSGYARASYSGQYGHNPDSLELANAFTFTGLNVSVTLPGPSSSWSLVKNTLTYSKEYVDTSLVTHNYSGINADGFITHVKQNVTAGITVGTNFYTIMSSDGAYI